MWGIYRHFRGSWYICLGYVRDGNNNCNINRADVLYISLRHLTWWRRATHEFIDHTAPNGAWRFKRIFPCWGITWTK